MTATSISKSADPTVSEYVTEEFSIEPDDGETPDLEDVGVQKVFEYGPQTIYRFDRISHRGCPCEAIEAHGLPIVDARADGGSLYLVFHAPDQESLRDVISTLKETHSQVEVRRLLQSDSQGEGEEDSLVFFDKSKFTDRQKEVLETAHRLGYFHHPKGANAGEVAEELGITTATFVQHLSAAQQKILDSILEADTS